MGSLFVETQLASYGYRFRCESKCPFWLGEEDYQLDAENQFDKASVHDGVAVDKPKQIEIIGCARSSSARLCLRKERRG